MSTVDDGSSSKRPDLKAVLINATNFHREGKLAEAEAGYRKVLRFRPEDFTANHMLGVIAQQCGLHLESIHLIKKALEIKPGDMSASSNLGVALMNEGLLDEAVEYLTEAIRIDAGYADAHHNLSSVLQLQGLFESALEHSLKAVLISPENASFNNSLANAYHELGDMDKAIIYYNKAVSVYPDYARAHTNSGITKLLAGQFQKGFREYHQWRFKQPGYKSLRSTLPSCPEWQGQSLNGKKILLLSEQGLGDSFQFVRYTDLLKQRYSCQIVLACQSHLLNIFNSLQSIDVLMSKADDLPVCDYYASLLSLPMHINEGRPYAPSSAYIKTDDRLMRQWKNELSVFKGLNIGLAWKGSDEYSGDHKRSFDPSVMSPLKSLVDINWFCLQMGCTQEKLRQLQSPVMMHCYPEMDKQEGGFMDTAALISNLDIVVTSDTSLAHLAGALGVKTCLALCYVPDWRWKLEGDTCDWYPTMKLFRQPKRGDWDSVFEEIASHLSEC